MPMTDAKILEAVEKLRYIVGRGYASLSAVRGNPYEVGPDTRSADSHLFWMLTVIPEMLADGRREKVMRWLGFIQGALWRAGDADINELKCMNRSEE
jgi:hypothetical protein